MIASVDTNILLDILIPGEPFSTSSKMLLDRHLAKGGLIICEVVFAELAAGFPSGEILQSFLSDTMIKTVNSDENSLFLAGSRWAEYARKSAKDKIQCGTCGHVFETHCPKCRALLTRRRPVLADFLIGAHALVHADCILSRDLGIYRTYFSELTVVDSI